MARVSMPSSNSRITFTLNDFSGGIVNNVNDVKMKDNQSPDMLNMQFRNDGLIQKRPGLVSVKEPPRIGDFMDCIPYEYAPNEHVMLYETPYQLYYENDEGKQIVIWEHPIKMENLNDRDVFVSCNMRLSYAHYNGELLFTEGLYLYSFSFSGINGKPKTCRFINPPNDFIPIAKPALTGETKERLVKEYKYFMFDDYSNVPDEPVVNDNIDIDDEDFSWEDYEEPPPPPRPIVDYYVDELPGGDLYEKWYEPCEHEMEDGYKGTNLIPPSIRTLAVHRDRVFLGGSDVAPNMVWISDILNPCYFPSGMALQTPPTDDYITALHVYNDALIVGRRDSLYAVFGNTNRESGAEPFQVAELNCHTGMPNSYSANKVYHMLFFVGSDGNMYKLHPPSTTADSFYTTQLNINLDITLPPFNCSKYSVVYAHSEFDSKEGLWYVQIEDHTFVYNYSLMAWTRYNNINPFRFFKVDNEIHLINLNGYIYKLPSKDANQNYFDEVYESSIDKILRVPINAYWTSRNMDMGQPARVKQFRDTYIVSESFEEYPTKVNVKYEVDYIDITDNFLIENEIAKWDEAIFNKSKFTSRNIDRSLPLMINRRGRTIKVYYGSGYNYIGVWWEIPEPGSVKEGELLYSQKDDAFFVRIPCDRSFKTVNERYFKKLEENDLNNALLIHNISGVYEFKGYR